MKKAMKYISVGVIVLFILLLGIVALFKTSGQKKAEEASYGENRGESGNLVDAAGEQIKNTGDYLDEGPVDASGITWQEYRFTNELESAEDQDYLIYVLRNGTGRDVDIYMDIDTANSDTKEAMRDSIYVNNFAKDSNTCVYTKPGLITDATVKVSAFAPQEDMKTITSDLKVEFDDRGDGVEGRVTNDSEYIACYTELSILFMKGDNVVYFGTVNLADDKPELAPGESAMFTLSSNGADYDKVNIYVAGYGRQ